MSTRKSYNVLFKRETLKKLDLNSGNIRKTSRECSVTPKMIRDWRSKSCSILSGDFKKSNRRIGSGRKSRYPSVERQLIEWIKEERESKNCVNYSRAIEKTRSIAQDLDVNFEFSVGWLQKVLRRNKLTVRKATHYGQENRRSFQEQHDISSTHLVDQSHVQKYFTRYGYQYG